jgi:DNA polymerase-3 subunit delta'
MGFRDILDQEPALRILTRALETGRAHHAYRFEGPAGVGKEKAAFAFAQSLVCEHGPLACEQCNACHRAITLSTQAPEVPLHPDVVLVGRALYPSALVGAAEATGISIEQIRRVVLGRAGYPPHEGRALVFIIRQAHELTPSAANALLKTLEEPIPRVHFVLLTDQPNRLLDTIRSRTLRVRFGPLSDETVRGVLAQRGLPTAVAELAGGSAALALTLADSEAVGERTTFARAALEAVDAVDLATGLRQLESRSVDRDGLKEQLAFLAHELVTAARVTIGSDASGAERAARRHAVVLNAIGELERNVQPTLVVESLLTRLRRV